ncbi:patatin-like phospholipase family protein [Kaistella palustris]|uniref:patatin-like phospholipase family protein n=1 Tax=Kaistella palustris TaxID=493376 RepID=UPI00040FC6E6|nr:patatin-like phospholipase family protein [Kaistella palustris]
MNPRNLEDLLADKTLDSLSKEKLSAVQEKIGAKEFSDIIDDEGNQYVNFVQEGGGVWGVALVGYLYALESFGIRFMRIAGTSAGAINTMLIAAMGDRSKNKSSRIKEILFAWKFEEFMDGKSIVKSLAYRVLKSKNYLKKLGLFIALVLFSIVIFPFLILFFHVNPWFYLIPFLLLSLLVYGVLHYYHLFKANRIGLNPGKAFENKMQAALSSFGIKSVSNLNEEYNKKGLQLRVNYRYGNGEEYFNTAVENIKNIHTRELANIDMVKFRFFLEGVENNDIYKENPFTLLRSDYTIITTDINAKIKVELPKMGNLYWTNTDLSVISPAKFVRASMSVPYFFEPLVVNIDISKASIVEAWKFWLNAEPANVYTEGVFVDGGSISNFPIDIFHESDIFYPRIPVFGVRLVDQAELGDPRGAGSKSILKSPASFLGSIFDTLKGYNDKSFLTKYTFYSTHSIQYVDCSPSNWLNFFMEDQEKTELFNKGFRAGLEFLERFDWEKYKYERMLVALKEKNILKQEAKPNVG